MSLDLKYSRQVNLLIMLRTSLSGLRISNPMNWPMCVSRSSDVEIATGHELSNESPSYAIVSSNNMEEHGFSLGEKGMRPGSTSLKVSTVGRHRFGRRLQRYNYILHRPTAYPKI